MEQAVKLHCQACDVFGRSAPVPNPATIPRVKSGSAKLIYRQRQLHAQKSGDLTSPRSAEKPAG